MSSTSAPFGLRPANHPSGTIRPVAGTIASAYAQNIFQNQPVKITTAGVIERADPGDRFIGTFQGVEWTDTDGRRRVSNRWSANTVGTDIVCYYTRDPETIYEMQSDASLALSDIGRQFDFTAVSGNTTTGLCTMMVGVSTAAANAGLQLVGITPGPDNAFGDNFVIGQFRISEHQLVADVAAF